METGHMTTLLILCFIVAFSRGKHNGKYPCTIFLAFFYVSSKKKKKTTIGTCFGYTASNEKLQLFTQGRCVADEQANFIDSWERSIYHQMFILNRKEKLDSFFAEKKTY